jgi:hypothetical protein
MKPATQISDRAKRYRANQETSEWPRVCLFCGSTSDLQVDHLDGFEENGEPENLLILCRSCNQLKSAIYKKAGLGRRTVQYNPGIFSRLFGPKETYHTTGGGHREFQRKLKQERADAKSRDRAEERELRRAELEAKRDEKRLAPVAVGRYKGFTLYKRRESPDGGFIYYSTLDQDSWFDSKRTAQAHIDTFKNPAAGVAHWEHAVNVLRGEASGSPFSAARVIRSTPVARRYQYLDRMMRANPSVPTFAQYAFAVSTHTRGAHDEGGAIIHATPPKLRSEYAERIADVKRDRGTDRRGEVPF